MFARLNSSGKLAEISVVTHFDTADYPSNGACVTDHVWSVADIVAIIEATEPGCGKRRAV
jgi:hypothetical protein